MFLNLKEQIISFLLHNLSNVKIFKLYSVNILHVSLKWWQNYTSLLTFYMFLLSDDKITRLC